MQILMDRAWLPAEPNATRGPAPLFGQERAQAEQTAGCATLDFNGNHGACKRQKIIHFRFVSWPETTTVVFQNQAHVRIMVFQFQCT